VVDEPTEKLAALRALSDHMIPEGGKRCADKRTGMKATVVLSCRYRGLRESAGGHRWMMKEDYGWKSGQGVIPLRLRRVRPFLNRACPQMLRRRLRQSSYERG